MEVLIVTKQQGSTVRFYECGFCGHRTEVERGELPREALQRHDLGHKCAEETRLARGGKQ